MEPLTKSQQKVYDFLRQEAPKGIPPTVREICAATGLRSTSTVHAHLRTLERLGYISRQAGHNRSIRIEGSENAAQVLKAADIRIYKSKDGTALANAAALEAGELGELTHFHAGFQGIQ